jgi:hypothetical protein
MSILKTNNLEHLDASSPNITLGIGGGINVSGVVTATAFKYDGRDLVGAVGAGTDRIFYENDLTVTTSYSITTGRNAMTAGPINVASGATVTVNSGSVWSIV